MEEKKMTNRKLTKKGILWITITASVLLVAALALIIAFVIVPLIRDKDKEILLNASDIAYLDEIQGKGSLVFEWLNPYNSERPTVIIFHGENPGKGNKKFSMNLDGDQYTTKKADTDTNFVVPEKIGYKAQGLNLDLSYYWLNVNKWNVVLFHWELFSDEESPDELLSKLFSVPKMRYLNGDGYETTRVPKNNLTEITAALYLKEFAGKVNGQEVRFVGNGLGANLALSVSHYLASFHEKGQVENAFLPQRLALCDPYLSVTNMNIAKDVVGWDDSVSTTEGMMGVADGMLSKVTATGCAVEMIENKEVSKENGTSYAYDLEKSETSEVTFRRIQSKVAYLMYAQSYSTKFSDEYKDLKRIALDWYLYSMVGSDDSGNAGGTHAAGYPRSLSDFQSYYTYSGFNWAPNETRPLMNNRAMTNDGSATAPSSRGKNYALSAWTPTVYTRALKGISFTQKKYVNKTQKKDVHGNDIYTYADYILSYFRSENFQVSDQKDYTLICGYVYLDRNIDGKINDGLDAGIANGTITVDIKQDVDSGNKKDVAFFSVKTDNNGFYAIRLQDKTVDSEGNYSKDGYKFDLSHSITLNFVPSSHNYYQIANAMSGVYYQTLSGHNYTKYATTLSMSYYYADAITVANCLVRMTEEE